MRRKAKKSGGNARNAELAAAQLRVDVVGKKATLRKQIRQDVYNSTALLFHGFLAVIEFAIRYTFNSDFAYSRLFYDSEIGDSAGTTISNFTGFLIYASLLLLLPFVLSDHRAKRKVKKIIPNNISIASVGELEKGDALLAKEIQAIQSRANIKFFISISAILGSFLFRGMGSTWAIEKGKRAGHALESAEQFMEKNPEFFSRLKRMNRDFNFGNLSEIDKAYYHSMEFQSYIQTFKRIENEFQGAGLFVLKGQGLLFQFLFVHLAESLLEFLSAINLPLLIGNSAIYLKDLYDQKSLSKTVKQQEMLLGRLVSHLDFYKWKLIGDGKKQLYIFSLQVDADASLVGVYFDEMIEFCKRHKLSIAIEGQNILGLFVPNLKASIIDGWKAELSAQVQERIKIETNYKEWLHLFKKLTQGLVKSGWTCVIERQQHLPVAIFEIAVESMSAKFLMTLESCLLGMHKGVSLRKTGSRLHVLGVDLSESENPRDIANLRAQLLDAIEVQDPDSSSSQDDRLTGYKYRLFHSLPFMRVKEEKVQPHEAEKSRIMTWKLKDGRRVVYEAPINKGPQEATIEQALKEAKVDQAVYIRGSINGLLIFAIISPEIAKLLEGGNSNLVSLYTQLNHSKLVGDYGSGVKSARTEKSGFDFKVKDNSNYRLYGNIVEPIVEPDQNSRTMLIEFTKMQETH